MWRTLLRLFYVVCLSELARPQEDPPAISPGNCSLACIQQGGPGCEYCRISPQDVERSLGIRSREQFGSCVPWPCSALLSGEPSEELCQHYVEAPRDVTVSFLPDQDSKSDSVLVSWTPSQYGISFLRGFQVLLQVLGGPHTSCQLLLFHRNISLSASHAQKVFQSAPFPGLGLGTQYAVTVLALPVPEHWDRFYHSQIFSTRSCPEKNGLENCKKDWYPRHVKVQQEGSDIIVTFNLAPPTLEIQHYFSLCYGEGLRRYTPIIPNSRNRTHWSYHLLGLQQGFNYTCEIAADGVDSVRRSFSVQVLQSQTDPSPHAGASASLTLLLPVGLVLSAMFVVLLSFFTRRRSLLWLKALELEPGKVEQQQDRRATQEEVTSLTSSRLRPPQLLICYSCHDGPAHIRAVMQLAVFIQQHMATQVCLDLWDSLRVAEEGRMCWLSRRLQESDSVLVLCSRGTTTRPADPAEGGSSAATALIAEELGRAKARGHDLSKYMTAIFEYSEEGDVPVELGLVPGYRLPRDLALLFSRLHGVELHRPGAVLSVQGLSEEGYATLPAGAALRRAMQEAGLDCSRRGARGATATQEETE